MSTYTDRELLPPYGPWITSPDGTLGIASTSDGLGFICLGVAGKLVDTTPPTNGQVLTYDSTSGKWAPATPSGGTGDLLAANNLSDVANTPTARTNLGLGTAATGTIGVAAGNVVALDTGAKLPAVDGSQLTNLPAAGGPKASVRFTISGGVITVVSSTNVSSVTYVSAGLYQINFTTPIPITAVILASLEAGGAEAYHASVDGMFGDYVSIALASGDADAVNVVCF